MKEQGVFHNMPLMTSKVSSKFSTPHKASGCLGCHGNTNRSSWWGWSGLHGRLDFPCRSMWSPSGRSRWPLRNINRVCVDVHLLASCVVGMDAHTHFGIDFRVSSLLVVTESGRPDNSGDVSSQWAPNRSPLPLPNASPLPLQPTATAKARRALIDGLDASDELHGLPWAHHGAWRPWL